MGRITAAITAAAIALGLMLMPVMAQDGPPVFEIERLNEGLPLPPDRVDRSTPRATMETLLRLGDIGDWEAAAHVLNLNALDPAFQQAEGPVLAQMLKELIDRKIVLDWAQLIDRPDALDVSESTRAATAGDMRRSLKIWEFTTDYAPAEIRLNRVKVGDDPPVWVFAERTLLSIAPLYTQYGPSKLEAWLPDILRTEAIWGLMWWELIGVPLLVALSVVVGMAVHRLVRSARRSFTNPAIRDVIGAAATPLVIAAVTTVIWWGASTIFVFSGRLDVIISPIIAIGFVAALLMLIVNTIEKVLDRLIGFDDIDLTSQQQAEQRDKATKLGAVRRLLVLVVFIIGCGIVLSTADVFRSLGFSILASAGALTLVLGFAARKVLGNIMASLQIALNQSARVGDRVVYKEHLCHVERINFTYVQLRDWDGTRVVVPVEEFVAETFENWTLKEPEMLRILKFKLHPSVDIPTMREAFSGVLDDLDQDQLDDREKASVKVAGQDVFGIDVWFAVPCNDPNTSWDVACEARELLVRRMNDLETDDARIFPEAAAAEAA